MGHSQWASPSEKDKLLDSSQPFPFPPLQRACETWLLEAATLKDKNANQTNNPFPRFAYRERDLFMKHILFSFRGKSCNHCKGKSMESALFCIKISLLYDLCGWDFQAGGAQVLVSHQRKVEFKMQRELLVTTKHWYLLPGMGWGWGGGAMDKIEQ